MKATFIYLSVILLLISQLSMAQTINYSKFAPQKHGTSCWAAVTANVLNYGSACQVLKECDLLNKTMDESIHNTCTISASCDDFGADNFLIKKDGYEFILQTNTSFLSLANPLNHALHYRQIIHNIKVKKRPLIWSFDFDGAVNTNHFVNIVGFQNTKNISSNHSRWLYIFDPKPNCVGTFYLKNYQTYQYPSTFEEEKSLQNTYVSIPTLRKSKGNYILTLTGKPSVSDIYADITQLEQWVANLWNNSDTTNKNFQKATGFDLKNGSELLLGTQVNIERVQKRDTTRKDTKISQIVIADTPNAKVIPVLRCAQRDTFPTFVSAIIIKRCSTDTNQIVIDRIQSLSISSAISKEIGLTCPNASLLIPATKNIEYATIPTLFIPGSFIEAHENVSFFQLRDTRVLDIGKSVIISENEFHKNFGKFYFSKYDTSDMKVISNPNRSLNSNLYNGQSYLQFITKRIEISDLREQIQQAPNKKSIKKLILWELKNR